MSTLPFRDLGLADKNAGGCACCAPGGHGGGTAATSAGVSASTPASSAPQPVVAELLVEGMTCSHCVRSVTEELSGREGVAGVEVALNPGGASRVRVASTSPLDAAAVREAVEEAGYTLTTVS